MLLLTRVRLINWHFFTDTTIAVGQATLLAGDNGSGKSTIIDAIQYALVAYINRITFNAAATDRRAGRTLESYSRCKVGSETLDYVRGDCITHVALEFRGDGRSFCAGVAVQAFRDGDTKEAQWVLETGRLEDLPFLSDGVLTPVPRFKELLRAMGGVPCATKRDYSTRLTHLLHVHRRNADFNPYLEALVRSVNFTPFTSVHDFVCNYILEERVLDISAMRENLMNYREAEREAEAVQRRIDRLHLVVESADEVERLARQIIHQNHYKLRLEQDETEADVAATRREHAEAESGRSRTAAARDERIDRRTRIDEQRQELSFALAQDAAHRDYERLRRNSRDLTDRRENEARRVERFTLLHKQVEETLGRTVDPTMAAEERTVLDRERDEASHEIARHRLREREIGAETTDLREEARDLERGIQRYPSDAVNLRSSLAERGIAATHFAELLEVVDPEWQPAVEGALGAHRFDLMVNEDQYAEAVAVYRDHPDRPSGFGLPDLARMHDEEVTPGSLAEVLEARTPQARRYVASLLADVMRSDAEHLRDHPDAITRDGLRYSGKRFERLDPETCSRWFIGAGAKARRLEQIRTRLEELDAELSEVRAAAGEAEARARVLREAYDRLHEMESLADAAERIESLDAEIAETERLLEAIDTTGFEQLNLQIAALAESARSLQREIDALSAELGRLEERCTRLAAHEHELTGRLERRRDAVRGFLLEYPDEAAGCEQYYEAQIAREKKQAGRLDYAEILSRWQRAVTGFTTRLENARSGLRELKQAYNRDFNALLPTEDDASREHRDALVRFEQTELPAYRDRIQRARREAEAQFREHFVSRLNEYVIQARDSFTEINSILNVIQFGRDQYAFTIHERPEKRGVLEVIRTAAEIRTNDGTLFEALASDEERAEVERLFERILDNDLDSPEVAEICDYRQYFQYDIRIRHTDSLDDKTGRPQESMLSKVLREKSGGEAQTPYYVAIAASFYRYYQDDPDAVRLVLFDEAFNKMDDDRIEKTIDFFRKLQMQIVTAVPTEKMEFIAPYMDQTNLIVRKHHHAHVREFRVLPTEAPA